MENIIWESGELYFIKAFEIWKELSEPSLDDMPTTLYELIKDFFDKGTNERSLIPGWIFMNDYSFIEWFIEESQRRIKWMDNRRGKIVESTDITYEKDTLSCKCRDFRVSLYQTNSKKNLWQASIYAEESFAKNYVENSYLRDRIRRAKDILGSPGISTIEL